ncbi:hypothetical protein [Sedimentimonas flavescens]|uniref:hypothetical protein n=1 Tax=Sedimentimonas flavescens TaxID=2851012 RepID=UPI001F45CAD5|nr:hypothetical protein [Sedimentimonas flavescens]
MFRDHHGCAGAGRIGPQEVARTRLILTDIDNWKEVIEARKRYCLNAARRYDHGDQPLRAPPSG